MVQVPQFNSARHGLLPQAYWSDEKNRHEAQNARHRSSFLRSLEWNTTVLSGKVSKQVANCVWWMRTTSGPIQQHNRYIIHNTAIRNSIRHPRHLKQRPALHCRVLPPGEFNSVYKRIQTTRLSADTPIISNYHVGADFKTNYRNLSAITVSHSRYTHSEGQR